MRRITIAALLLSSACYAAQLKEAAIINDRVVAIHLDELDSFRFHTLGGNGVDGAMSTSALDVTKAADPASFTIDGVHPTKVGRKTRPHTFVRTPKGEEHALEHYIYLVLPQPLPAGKVVNITLDAQLVSSGPSTTQISFDAGTALSDAIQINQLGYVPNGQKIAYVSQWMGDLGGAAFVEGSPFRVIDQATGKDAFTGRLALRKKASETDSGQAEVGNTYRTDLYECDFTPLKQTGTFRLSIDGVGCSTPFTISTDIYREAYLTAIRGMYHQRCGTELAESFTRWVHPACHREPLRQTDHRYMDAAFSDGPVANVPFKETGELRTDVWGGWHDAGDWDREMNHLDIASHMLLAYELTPDHYADRELNIPESGNGIPDLIDEARWGVDYYCRVQRPAGGVSVGMFESRWPKDAEVSWTDTLVKYCYAEDPQATYKHAAAAAHMARVLRKLGHADDAAKYADSAVRAWKWAGANLRDGDDVKVRDDRFHAAAALYRLTGDAAYQDRFKADCLIKTPNDRLFVWQKHEQSLGAWTMALAEDDLPGLDRSMRDVLRQASINYAREVAVRPSERRGNRRGYDWYFPLSWGKAAQTDNLLLMVAHKLSGDPAMLDVMIANANVTLGSNPLNMTWVTGLGRKSPHQVMQINYWYDPKGPNAGVTPMGPFAYSKGIPAKGVWLPGYAMKFVYPAAEQWPPLELWFENRLCPPTNEFVVSQEAITGCSFGYLCAPVQK